MLLLFNFLVSSILAVPFYIFMFDFKQLSDLGVLATVLVCLGKHLSVLDLLYKDFVKSSIMSVVPHGALAARKARANEEKLKHFFDKMDLSPVNYNGKFMNSIWGQYNRYSVHNLKKNIDETCSSLSFQQPNVGAQAMSVGKTAGNDLGTMVPTKKDKGNYSVSPQTMFAFS